MHIGHRQEETKISYDKIGEKANAAVEEVIYRNNAVGAIVGYYDEPLTILSVSDYLLNELGYTPETFTQITEGSLRKLFSTNDSSFLEADRFPKIKGEGEGKIYTAGGALVTVHLFKDDAVDADGVTVWVMSVNVDWENENLALIMEALESASWYMDCDEKSNITQVYWSAAFRKILGYRDTIDFPNRLESWSDLLHPDDRDIILKRLTDAIQDHTNRIKYDVEYRLRMQNGDYQWFRAIAEVTRRADGSALRISGVFVNIDKSKKDALQAGKVDVLLQKNASMEHLVHSVTRMVDHFAICDLKNDQYEYTRISLSSNYPSSGKYSDFIRLVFGRFKTLPPLASLETLLSPEYLRTALQTEDSMLKFEYCSVEEDVFRMANFIPLEWEDGVVSSVLWASTDITSVKMNEIAARKALTDAYHAADRASRAKTEFLSNMSHDIRTPMNAIIGMTAIAGASIDNPEHVLECLGKITSASRHLLGLINEVLDMARIESGKMTLADEEFNLSELVDNLLTMVKSGIEEHHHNLEIHINKIKHEDVCGDSLRIQQMFVNIMSNAIKYTPDGGKIVFSIEEKANKNSELGCYEFTVEDNGIGMTPEFQKIMFEPFTRADDHRTTKVQGTGLGMAIMKNIVNMMNGTIHVESAPDKGTKISVTIYLKLREQDDDTIRELRNLPVLVVDDDQSCCESTAAILNEIGLFGEWVLSGQEAIEKAFLRHEQNDDYFAIIMDWKMPGMDGYEATAAIRSIKGPRSRIPIVAMTANAFAEDVQIAKNAGMNEHIAKPLDLDRLNEVLAKWLMR